jgi:hypothetical protein
MPEDERVWVPQAPLVGFRPRLPDTDRDVPPALRRGRVGASFVNQVVG